MGSGDLLDESEHLIPSQRCDALLSIESPGHQGGNEWRGVKVGGVDCGEEERQPLAAQLLCGAGGEDAVNLLDVLHPHRA